MPKVKPKKALQLRFKKTGTGKILRSKQGRRHILTKKAPKRKRHLKKAGLLSPAFSKLYSKLIGGV